jgi:hypothetical protein
MSRNLQKYDRRINEAPKKIEKTQKANTFQNYLKLHASGSVCLQQTHKTSLNYGASKSKRKRDRVDNAHPT